MAFAKTHLFPRDLQELSLIGKMLCHPARIQIIQLLAVHGQLNVFQLCQELPLSKKSTSRHLAVLRECEMVVPHVNHPTVYYELNVDTYQKVSNRIQIFNSESR